MMFSLKIIRSMVFGPLLCNFVVRLFLSMTFKVLRARRAIAKGFCDFALRNCNRGLDALARH